MRRVTYVNMDTSVSEKSDPCSLMTSSGSFVVSFWIMRLSASSMQHAASAFSPSVAVPGINDESSSIGRPYYLPYQNALLMII